jgi:Holliday junction resolvase RusA-like endonuclease
MQPLTDPIVSFKVYGNPVPQGRPRIIKKGLHYGMKDPDQSRVYKDRLRFLAQQHRQDPLLSGPLHVSLVFTILKPASARKRDVWRAKKPDLDNLIKAVTDAFTGVIWRDDALIVSIEASKPYGVSPGVLIQVWDMAL